MVESILLNGKTIPVPIPIRTLGALVEWIDATLLGPGQSLTRLCIDGKAVDDLDVASHGTRELRRASRIECQVDSARDLAIESLDAMRNLVSVVLGLLKPLAVECWQMGQGVRIPQAIDSIQDDLRLAADLYQHVRTLIDDSEDLASVDGIVGAVVQMLASLAQSRHADDWKAYASLLLNRLEPTLKDLLAEAEHLQVSVLVRQNTDAALSTTRAPKSAANPYCKSG